MSVDPAMLEVNGRQGPPDPEFAVVDARTVRHAAAPMIMLDLPGVATSSRAY